MDPIKIISEIISNLPLSAIAKDKLELVKTQVETMEVRLKLAEDQAKYAEEGRKRAESERDVLRAENTQLREQLGASMVTDEFEERGPFLVKKGTEHLLCPNCKIRLAQRDTYWMCTKCKWGHETPSNWKQGRVVR